MYQELPVQSTVEDQTQNWNVISNKTKQKLTKSVAENSIAVCVLYGSAGSGLPYRVILFLYLVFEQKFSSCLAFSRTVSVLKYG
jgi:hypothetical protein